MNYKINHKAASSYSKDTRTVTPTSVVVFILSVITLISALVFLPSLI